ncbi:alpha/beta hydrolase [Arthrobacter sp. MI7-26]|uniref:alpha/beta hydrolase n=1 Tax=Arthrobacter sp. MI7-26 TaxID=2993653 RepID=UPI002248B83E|nr:alpha/beta hydrolase [Arthrobacter sp. MI7-26]MCX2750028.1 alpha/beta hydrolase [Arthrobacter sp. MI7-26]
MLSIPEESECSSEYVFLNYTQDELDDAYNQLRYAREAASVGDLYNSLSIRTRSSNNFSSHSYGASADETLDYFHSETADSNPIFIFIHGGEWRLGTKEMYSFLAPAFLDAGIDFVSLDFSLIPSVRIPEMSSQIHEAVRWIYNHSRELGGNPDQIVIGGHSSGAHLAAVLAVSDWTGYSVPQDVVKGALCLSGVYDLYPVILSYRKGFVSLSTEEVLSYSPIRHISPERKGGFIVSHGTRETPEFQRQSAAFAAMLGAGARDLVVMEDRDHFEVLLELANSQSVLFQKVISLVTDIKTRYQ